MSRPIVKPIFIVGSPKSGTSILGRILAHHSTVAHLIEPRLTWKYGNDSKSDILTANDARPDVAKRIHKKFGEFLEKNDKHRLLEKTPSNVLRIPFVKKVFPDAKFIHIIRNGYDSSLSIRNHWGRKKGLNMKTRLGAKEPMITQRLKELHWTQIPFYVRELFGRLTHKHETDKPTLLWGARLPGMRQMMKELEFLEVCALQWRYSVELGCQEGRQLSSDVYREYRLEALNREMIDDILDFAELEREPSFFEYYEKNYEGSQASWRRDKASDEDLATIKKWIEPTMNWLNYD